MVRISLGEVSGDQIIEDLKGQGKALKFYSKCKKELLRVLEE